MTGSPTGPIAGHGERILVVEDEPAFAELIALWLERHGWRPEIAPDGAHALRAVADRPPDLIVLDLGLPRVDGWHVIERVREESLVPIIVVTARGSEADKVRGLATGADDYMTKPLSFPELVARVAAALRRARARPPKAAAMTTIERPGIRIDGRSHQVLVADAPVHLTPTEYRLLRHLAERDGILVSHADLLVAVWGAGYRDDHHLLRVAIRNLRAKLGAAAPARRFIATEYGLGYRFSADGGDEGG
ncbi:MAG TPA: response regulator transcription factor [Candidatus Nanopelagicales bacterium]|nr:response regulator transcription factor [Candidatus Nanopelagicales bacterium]